MRKHVQPSENDEEGITSDYLEKLDKGGLQVPTLNMAFLLHSAMHIYEKLEEPRRRCTKYFRSLLEFVDTPFSHNKNACRSFTNVIFKADVLHSSDKENGS